MCSNKILSWKCMPMSLQSPSPAEKKITAGASTCAPEISSCSTFMSITQYKKRSASPPRAPKPSGRMGPFQAQGLILLLRLVYAHNKNYFSLFSRETMHWIQDNILWKEVAIKYSHISGILITSRKCKEYWFLSSYCRNSNKFWNMKNNETTV